MRVSARALGSVLLAAGALAAVVPAAATGAAAPGSALAGFWRTEGVLTAPGGQFMRDPAGRRIELHGANLVAKCGGGAVAAPTAGTPCVGPAAGSALAYVLSPADGDPGRRFTAADAATLARLGFTMVRLGIIWEGLEPGLPGVGAGDPRYCSPHVAGTPFPALGAADPFNAATVSAYLRRTDRIVSLLAAAGIRVIIDMHQDSYGSAFSNPLSPLPWTAEGAPPWATCTNGVSSPMPTSWAQAISIPAVQDALHNFWANDVSGDLQGQLARVWHAVAAHFRGDPDVIGYELYNEPLDPTSARFDSELQCFYAGPRGAPQSCRASGSQAQSTGLIGAVRSADPAHPVVYEPPVTANFGVPETVGIAEPMHVRNLVMAFHVYAPQAGAAGCVLSACGTSERTAITVALSERGRTRTGQPGGPAIMLDEFGAEPYIPDIARVVALADARGLSWSYWQALQLDDPTGQPQEWLIDQRTGSVWAAKAHALAGAYPLATAGTPETQSYRPSSGTLILTYRVDLRVHAPTVIIVAPYVYPHGYTVATRGATVVSSRNAELLELRAARGARSVSVVVRRTG